MGDKYMAVSGLPDICENHAVSIARLALDMIDKADTVRMGDQPVVSYQIIFSKRKFVAMECETKFFSLYRKLP